MHNLKRENSIYLLVGISFALLFFLAYLKEQDLSNIKEFIGLAQTVLPIDLFFIAIFTNWAWKFKIFKGWLVTCPDLNGSWVGFIHSDWKNNEKGQNVQAIPVLLNIKQSLFNLSCSMRTTEMESSSHSEGFLIDPDRQLKKIAYSYFCKPRISLSDRSIAHNGAVIFNIIEKPAKRLEGIYWTDRNSKGEIFLNYYSKEISEELPDNFGVHPFTEDENRR
jgi:hypothetical protein